MNVPTARGGGEEGGGAPGDRQAEEGREAQAAEGGGQAAHKGSEVRDPWVTLFFLPLPLARVGVILRDAQIFGT